MNSMSLAPNKSNCTTPQPPYIAYCYHSSNTHTPLQHSTTPTKPTSPISPRSLAPRPPLHSSTHTRTPQPLNGDESNNSPYPTPPFLLALPPSSPQSSWHLLA